MVASTNGWMRLAALVVLGLLTACATPQLQVQQKKTGEEPLWRADPAEPRRAVLSEPQRKGSDLVLQLRMEQTERLYLQDLVTTWQRTVTDGSLLGGMAVLATGGLYCVVDESECGGSATPWAEVRTERTAPRATEQTRVTPVPPPRDAQADVTLQARHGEGASAATRRYGFDAEGRLRVPIKSWLESLPSRPDAASVHIALTGDAATTARYALDAQELAALQLSPQAWLAPQERQAQALERLKEHLVRGEHKQALEQFALLEQLQLAQPASFYYVYAQSLRATGQAERARSYLQQYLERAGDKGVYSPEARAQLAAP